MEYVDLEYKIEPAFVSKVKSSFLKTKIIASFHYFEKTPKYLGLAFRKIPAFSTDIYKMCTYPRSCNIHFGLDCSELSDHYSIRERHDLLIIATSVGIAPNVDKSIFDPKYLRKDKIVFDFVYKSTKTPFNKRRKKSLLRINLYIIFTIFKLKIMGIYDNN